MKYIVFTFALVFTVVPTSVFAVCSDTGATVIYVNGVMNSRDDANASMYALEKKFQKKANDPSITFITGYNPSRLNGAGDMLQSAAQILNGSITDHDLVTILTQIQPEVTTRKILLVGHSQGTFYTNEMYTYLIAHGVPKESIAVYNIATPAHEVQGNGGHLTSSNDSAIQKVTAWAQTLQLALPLPANIDIPIYPDDAQNDYPGHNFIRAYIAGAANQIVSDVSRALNALTAKTSTDTCFTAPRLTEAYRADGITLAIGDFVSWYVFGNPVDVAQTIGTYLGNTAVTVAEAIKNAGSSLLALVYSVPVPPASSLIAGALPVVSEQTLSPDVSVTPMQETSPGTEPAPQTTPEVAIPSAQLPVGETITASTTDITLAMVTSIMETIAATSTQEISATSTTEIAVVITPIFQGSGSVTGVSAEDLAKQAQAAQEASLLAQNTATTTEQTATSTTDITTTTTQQSATSTADVTATSTADTTVTPKTEIAYDPNPVVINEIAWMGTKAQANDEWIELYNRTDTPVDLSGWTLESKNKSLSVVLAGNVAAHGYFLLERTASTTTDRQEDMVYTGALNNAGPDANIYLKNGTTTIDAVDFGYWPFGENSMRRTMERVSQYATSTLYYNWKTYSESVATPFAKDAKDNDVFGTPGAKNSTSGFYTPAGNITENTTWYAKYSPYYIPTTITVRKGATLTIEPGTVVKIDRGVIHHEGELLVSGSLKAEGTRDSPIIFTSFLDDAVDGIDSNQDATSTSPAAGDWRSITFTNPATPSVIRFADIRYGGGPAYPFGYSFFAGMISIQNASPTISDSVLDAGKEVSMYVKGDSHPIVSGNTIKNTVGSRGYGVWLADASSTADIIGNTFEDNGTAIISQSASDVPLVVRNNIFANNRKNGEFNGYANFNLENANNQDTNHKGGFSISFYVKDGKQKTLRADSMPYIMKGGITVSVGGVLTIEQGAVLKSAPSAPVTIHGTLKAQGTAECPVIFTSLADDSDGYDSNYSDAKPVPGDWQNIQFLGASSSESVLEHVTIRYGGQGQNQCPYAYFGGPCMEYKGAVLIDGASPAFSQTNFDHNQAISIYVQGTAKPTIGDSHIINTVLGITGPYKTQIAGYGISIGSESAPTLQGNVYSGNVEDVVYR